MQLSGPRSGCCALGTAVTLAFLYIPLIVIAIYAFNSTRVQKWPPAGLTFSWFYRALHNPGVRDALATSVKAALLARPRSRSCSGRWPRSPSRATASSGARRSRSWSSCRSRCRGSSPAWRSTRPSRRCSASSLGLLTIVIGHATFCIVVVFNNVVARLRRTSTSFEEASADLGASGLQTFRYVIFPQLRSALVAGALLAFALSFDEIIVTTFTAGQQQTLPIWIFANLSRPRQLPIVNVVARAGHRALAHPGVDRAAHHRRSGVGGAARGEVGGEAGA